MCSPNIELLMVPPPPPNLKVAPRSLFKTEFSELLKVSKYYNQWNFLLYCIIGFKNYQSFHYRTHGPGHMAPDCPESTTQFPSPRFLPAACHFRRHPKTSDFSEGFRRFPKIFKNFEKLSECLFLHSPVLFPKFSKEFPNIQQRRHEPLLQVTDRPLNFFMYVINK